MSSSGICSMALKYISSCDFKSKSSSSCSFIDLTKNFISKFSIWLWQFISKVSLSINENLPMSFYIKIIIISQLSATNTQNSIKVPQRVIIGEYSRLKPVASLQTCWFYYCWSEFVPTLMRMHLKFHLNFLLLHKYYEDCAQANVWNHVWIFFFRIIDNFYAIGDAIRHYCFEIIWIFSNWIK